MATQRIEIDGMSCAACAGRAERALKDVPGVGSASVNFASGVAMVAPGTATLPDLIAALDKAHYPARTQTVMLQVDGLSCAACVRRAEQALSDVPGVVAAVVNLTAGSARIEQVTGGATPAALAQVLSDAGYPATAADHSAPDPAARAAKTEQQAKWLAILSAILTLPVFVTEMGGHLVPAFHHYLMGAVGQTPLWMMQFVLTTLVLIGPGARFFTVGVPALLKGSPEMNSLVALGSFAAWAYSCVVLFAPDVVPQSSRAVYFEAAAVIVTLILVGRWLEARARGRAGAAIQALIGLQPKTAQVLRDGVAHEVALEQIRTGDMLRIRPGERIAVDGRVSEGASHVNEAMISGEAKPVSKTTGDTVIGGTINGQGALDVVVTGVGGDTVLARIIAMVEQAQAAKLPVQALADRVVALFVPAVLAIALLAVLVWIIFGPDPALSRALVAGVSVLIIACPCAMGLATPTSIMVGTGRAAELGVFFRQGDALQRLTDTRVVAFDKTGTLTEGRMQVSDIAVVGGHAQDDVVQWVGALEARSEHPVAQALVAAAGSGALPGAREVEVLAGRGIKGRVAGHDVQVGSARMMQEAGLSLDMLSAPEWQALTTRVYAAVDGQAVARFGLSDTIKPGSAAAIDRLHEMGVVTAMISGDAVDTANAVGKTLGIEHVKAGLLPEGKVEALEHLRTTIGPVVFVGDGINDAPALARADVGIAVGSGTDVSIEAADVVLMSDDPGGVLSAIRMAKATLRNIRQNLFWAFAYNVALIPVAAGLLYPFTGMMLSPMLAAGAMALSSVFVISNALRLRSVEV
ncbi:MAG: copper-translocating P-type ATPase [Roseovarius sp.]